MKITILAVVLSAASSTAAAEGFAPWENRAVIDDVNAVPAVDVMTSRFAPWENRNAAADRNAMTVDVPAAGFHPWS